MLLLQSTFSFYIARSCKACDSELNIIIYNYIHFITNVQYKTTAFSNEILLVHLINFVFSITDWCD